MGMKTVRYWLILSVIFSLNSNFASAQEELMPSGETSTSFEPPPIGGAAVWSGSAQSNILMEDGSFIPQRRNPWGVSWFNWASVNMKDYREGEGRLETYNYLSFDYRINWESKISIRPEFYVSGAGRDFFGDYKEGETEIGDLYLQYFHRSWMLLGPVGVLGALRAYYPNSENSKRQKWLTKLQARLIFQAPLGNGFWASYHFRPMYFVHTQRASQTEFFNARANEHYRLEQWLEFSKILTSRLAIHQQFGVEHRRYYDSEANNLDARTDGYVSMGTSLSYFMGQVSFRGGVTYESKIAVPDRNPNPYNEGDTKYYLMTSVRM
jgi:hypothetical protein